jgi:hypothetical protein
MANATLWEYADYSATKTANNPTLYLRGMLEEVLDRPNLSQKRP